jgi:H+/Cl- antiporter ClcA
MAHNDFIPVTDEQPKKSVKKQMTWTAIITVVISCFAYILIYNGRQYHNFPSSQSYFYEWTTITTIVLLIVVGLIFFLTLGILLLKSIEWKDPKKCEKTLHYFYLALLVLSMVGVFSGIVGLMA